MALRKCLPIGARRSTGTLSVGPHWFSGQRSPTDKLAEELAPLARLPRVEFLAGLAGKRDLLLTEHSAACRCAWRKCARLLTRVVLGCRSRRRSRRENARRQLCLGARADWRRRRRGAARLTSRDTEWGAVWRRGMPTATKHRSL